MMRRIVVLLIAISCIAAMMAPLGCGKYGRPQRVSAQQQEQPAADGVAVAAVADDLEHEDDRKDEAPKSRKP